MSKFNDPKSVIRSVVSVLLGIAAYCVIVAPLFKSGAYWENVKETYASVGVGLSTAVLVIGVVWLVFLSVRNKGK
ncbi:hypothetical protein [Corynebacterium sp.]|uniref:hypothetical protein n=1 Tax=Corynebacterium sp. TaxID=1720 RepID=UPI0026DDB31C|nr:hypothetical protein [Corynebacterium sp.]MDO5031910.1 hypothetical protein [Corynebacterium sp.]